MALMSTAAWNKLERPGESGCPKLFYAFSKEPSSLTLSLTDLVAIWQCSLDSAGIIESAKEQHTSIDPSESNAQLRVLLDKLDQSLRSRDNYLSRHRDETAQTVYLTTKLHLPNPLKPLSWTFKLTQRGSGELAEQLLRPCLHEASIATQKLESLVRVIKDKDHVLMRLLEKVDSLGTDLSLVFPGITGLKSRKGRVTAKEAQKHVVGMAEFDHERWLRGFDQDSPYAGFYDKGMNSLVAGCEKCPKHTVQQHDSWMEELPVHGQKQSDDGSKVKRPVKRKNSGVSHTDDSQSDFERQATPPHLRKERNSNGTNNRDERDSRPAKKAKLGRVGGSSDHDEPKKRSEHLTSTVGSESEARSASEVVGRETTVQDKTTAKADSETDSETASDIEDVVFRAGKVASQPEPSQDVKGTGLRKLGRLTSHSSEQHSSSQSRSVTPIQPAGRNANLANQQVTPKKHTASSTNSNTQPHSPSTPRNPDRRGNALDHKPSQQHNSIPDDHTNTSAASNEPPIQPLPSRSASASTSNPTTPRKLGRLKQPPLSRSNTASEAEPNTPSKTPQKTLKDDVKPGTSMSPSKKPRVYESDASTETDTDTDIDTGITTKTRAKMPNTNIKTNLPPGLDPNTTTQEPNSNSQTNPNLHPNPNTRSNRPSPPTQPQPPPLPRETAEEAANRRRNELKQKLSGAGGPGRKTRKF